MAKPEVGSVIEIRTKRGLAYAQYTHHVKPHGALVRVFREIHGTRPAAYDAIVRGEELFRGIFIPLEAGLKKGSWEVVAVEPVPEDRRSLPLFRAAMRVPKPGGGTRVSQWWLWDGAKEWPIDGLSGEQRRFPIRMTVNDTALAEMIERGGYGDVWDPA